MSEEKKKPSVWEVLSKIDCSKHTEQKNGLTYLSWAWAWSILKANYPTATSTVYETPDGVNYFTDGRTCWVKTGVTVEGVEHIEMLPVMDFRNKSIPLDNVTSYEVNKAIQRSLTKAIARHGLGMYIYAGEDMPSEDDGKTEVKAKPEVKPAARSAAKKASASPSEAAMQCWNAWREAEFNVGKDNAELKKSFNDLCVKIVGKAARECAAGDWDEIIKEIA